MAEAVEGDAKTKARIRFAVQQWIDAASPSNFLALNPEAQQLALKTQGREPGGRHAHLLQDVPARATCRITDESAFEVGPQRRDHRRLGGLRMRAVPADRVQAADANGARAADADGAAVHQQVLHPGPAARELADPLHGRAGPPHCSS
jgi:hypothetical protein